MSALGDGRLLLQFSHAMKLYEYEYGPFCHTQARLPDGVPLYCVLMALHMSFGAVFGLIFELPPLHAQSHLP